MNLKGKKAVFLGDSITEGFGVTDKSKLYHQLIKERLELSDVVNYGIGGTKIAKQKKPSENPQCDMDFVSRVDGMDSNADLVVVFGGVNDYSLGDAPIGDMSDRTCDTFCGAYHVLLEKLINKYPTSQIVVMTPLHMINDTDPHGTAKPEKVGTLLDYVDKIRKIAENYAIPVLDLYAVSGIQPNVEIIRNTYCPDGVHPNEAGQELIANKLEGFLKSL